MIDAMFNEKLEMTYELGRRHPVMFLYVKEGHLELKSHGDNFIQKVNANEAVILAPEGDANYSICLPENVHVKVAQVNVIRYLFLQKIECDLDTKPEPLSEMFKDTIGAKSFYYTTASDPSSVNAISSLFGNDQSGLERKLHLESYATKLVTSLIKTFRIENNPSRLGTFLRKLT